MDIIYLTLGEKYIVELDSLASAGYLWVPDADLQLTINKRFKEISPDTGTIGGPVKQYFDVLSDVRGEFRLVLNHMRPWNEDIIDTKIYNFVVR